MTEVRKNRVADARKEKRGRPRKRWKDAVIVDLRKIPERLEEQKKEKDRKAWKATMTQL